MDMRIADLTEPGFFNGTIYCRVICKRPVRTFPEEHMVSVALKDESGEIRAVAFKNQATRMERLLHLNQVYRIKTFKLQTKRDQHSQSPHNLEIVFREETLVIPTPDDGNLPHRKHHFVQLSRVPWHKLKRFVDVIGVVVDTGELEQCTNEDGKTSDMRDVTLLDQSGYTTEARLWGRLARDFDGSDHPVLAFGNIMTSSDPNANKPGLSRFLDTKVQTSVLENPDFPETRILREWYDKDDLLTAEDTEMDVSNASTSLSGVEDIQRSIKDALKNGSVKVKIVKSVFLGPPGVGKTQLKQALRGDFRESSESRISSHILRKLQVRGVLTPECLSKLDIPDTLGTLPGFRNKLLGWLVDWCLAAKMDGEDQWFIPSVLPPRPPNKTLPFDDSLSNVLHGFSGQAQDLNSTGSVESETVDTLPDTPIVKLETTPIAGREITQQLLDKYKDSFKSDPNSQSVLQRSKIGDIIIIPSPVCFEVEALRNLPLEKDLREISDNCGDSWKRLLTYVGLKSTKIQEFKTDEDTLPDACFQGLVYWLGGNVDDSDPVNWSTLLTAMKKAGMAGNGRKWKQKIVERCAASLDKPRDAGQSGNDETSTPRLEEAN